MVRMKRMSRRKGIYLVTLLGCLSLILGGQSAAYAQCGVDWTCQIVDDGAGIDNVGQYTSLAFDASGRPAISYYDVTNDDLKLAYDRNGDEAFTPTEIITVDSSGDVGQYTSLAFDDSGRTAISYYDYDNGYLKFAYDRDGDGIFAGEEIAIVDDGGGATVGQYTSLAFGTGPAISYLDVTNRALKLAYDRNNNGNFSDTDDIITVDNTNAVGLYTSLAFGTGPAISYYDWTNSAMKFAYDGDNDGVFASGEIITVDNAGYVGLYTSLAFDPSGNAAISYWDSNNRALKFAYDRDSDGVFASGEIITVDNAGYVGLYTSLAFDLSGKPSISYFDQDNSALKFAYDWNKNGNFSDAGDIITVDSTDVVGLHTSVAFDASRRPAISYYDMTNTHDYLKLARFSPPHPSVVSTSPGDGDTDVAVTTSVSASFDEAIDVSTLDFTFDSMAGDVSYDEISLSATFTPKADLGYITTYNVSISASDLAGNPMPAPVTWDFTTEEELDTTPPNVISTSPGDGDTDVAVTTSVSASFDEAIDVSTLDFTFDSVAGDVSYDEISLTATFTPKADLDYITTYNVSISASDLAGNPMPAPHIWSFSTQRPPTISYTPTNGLHFHAKENGDSPKSRTLTIRNSGPRRCAPLVWTISDDVGWLTLAPTSGIIPRVEMNRVSVSVDTGEMDAGVYSATITIEAPAATNTPQQFEVILTIK
jgi:hypothetical protein